MANQQHLGILAKGVGVWNKWREENRDVRPVLRDANLSRAKLSRIVLSDTDLRDAGLDRAELDSAALRYADLRGTDLSGAKLRNADLSGANLVGAFLSRVDARGASLTSAVVRSADMSYINLRGADLSDAEIHSSIVKGADFSDVFLQLSRFLDVDLSEVRGLDSAQHDYRSTVGLDTIYMSNGRIPEPFLRGCGVPESFLTYMRALVGTAIDFYSVFISYSTLDQKFADRLYADLQAHGVRCWFAPQDVQGGKKLHEQIDEAIRIYDKLLLILSDASMNSSWVKTEIANAYAREQQQNRQMLFPITLVPFDRIREWKLFDADRGIDSAREIREYFIPDFSNWKDHDSYQKAFDRLLRDLKAGASPSAITL